MYITKNILAEQIQRRISGGDVSDDSEFDPREIILFIEQALAVLVKDSFITMLRVDETVVGAQYISSFMNVEVVESPCLKLSYSIVPRGYIDLHSDRGIHQISLMEDQENSFVPVRNGSTALYSKSSAGRLEGRTSYYPEGARVYYNKNLNKDGIVKVLIKLIVPSPSDLGNDDPYPIGTDMELPVILKVLELMGIAPPTDDVNDSSNK
jgi:hypothetical protein